MGYKIDKNIITISSSEIVKYLDCPWKWHLNSELGEIFRDNQYNLYGTALHHGIQQLFCSKSVLQCKKEFEELLRESFTKNSLTFYIEDYLQIGRYFIESFDKSDYRKLELRGLEFELYENIIVNFLFFHGFIDLWLSDGTKQILLDLKTSKNGWNQKIRGDKKKLLQLLLYKYFLSKKFNFDSSSVVCDFVIFNQSSRQIESFTIDSSKEKTDSSFQLLWSVVNKMYNTQDYIIKNNLNCNFCDWKDTQHCDRKSTTSQLIELEKIVNIIV